MTYILDRTNGKPLIGIEERPVPQEPGEQDRADAAVSARRFARAELSRARQRRDRRDEQLRLRRLPAGSARRHDAGHARRIELGAGDVQSADEALLCARPRSSIPSLRPGFRGRAASRARAR